MKIIASVIAGLVLGTTGTAVAAQHGYWSESGTGYRCQGISTGAFCDSGRFQVGVTKTFVYVQEHGTKLTYGCTKFRAFANCFSD